MQHANADEHADLPIEHGGQSFAFAQSHELCISQVHDFSASINPLQPQIDWQQLSHDAQQQIPHYPEEFNARSHSTLLPFLAKTFDLPQAHITLCNGISQAIWQLFATLPISEIFLFSPIYAEYQNAAQQNAAGYTKIHSTPKEWLKNKPTMAKYSVVVLVNPSTPQGSFLTVEELQPLLKFCAQQESWLLIDESFLPFITLDKAHSLRQFVDAYPQLIVLQSLSKFYACPGVRIGALFSRAKQVKNLPDIWTISTLDRLYLQQALQDDEHPSKTHLWLKNSKQDFYNSLSQLHCVHHMEESHVNFILLAFDRPVADVQRHLDAYHILIRPASSFGFASNYARLAIRLPEENQQLLDALQALPVHDIK
ncbi:aminotransferase class I/II-fold pyridoxal phosphate-dependent enzyme [Thiosulfatimonas sediminis]|nr:aminotransferase class I/II-fold pyridoxal phosphate-dependent enzyme [Thiosulfatimonas sediminis]